MKWRSLRNGEVRIVRRFAWAPVIIGEVTVWLRFYWERRSWCQNHAGAWMHSFWQTKALGLARADVDPKGTKIGRITGGAP